MSFRRMIAALLVMLAACDVCGQANTLVLPLEPLSIPDAMAKAKREHRVLIVVRKWKRPPPGRRPWWSHDAMRLWLQAHAVLVDASRAEPDTRWDDTFKPFASDTIFWGVEIMIDGQRRSMTRCWLFKQIWAGDPLCPDPCDPPSATGPIDEDPSRGCMMTPTASAMLQQFDFALECAKEMSPIFGMLHDADCPMPERPARRYLHRIKEGGLEPVSDIDRAKAPMRCADVMERVLELRSLDPDKDAAHVVSLATWAWERAEEHDETFAFVKGVTVLSRMVPMSKKEPAARDRLNRLVDEEVNFYAWMEPHERVQYLRLLRAVGSEKLQPLVKAEGVEEDAVALGGPDGQAMFELIAACADLPIDTPPTTKEWKAFTSAAEKPIKKLVTPEAYAAWLAERVPVAAVGACGAYELLLRRGDAESDERASEAAAWVLNLAEKSPPPVRARVRRGLVMAAILAGRVGETQKEWLREAAAMDPPEDAKAKLDPLVRYVR